MCGQFQVQLLVVSLMPEVEEMDPEVVVNVAVEEGKPISAPSVTELRSMGFLVKSENLRRPWRSAKIFLYKHCECY